VAPILFFDPIIRKKRLESAEHIATRRNWSLNTFINRSPTSSRSKMNCKTNTDEPWRLAGVVEGKEEGPGAAHAD
jgi:hypothetical protein